MKPLTRIFAAAIALTVALAACESPTDPPPPPPPPPVLQLDSVSGLIPGQTATVWGRELSSIQQLTLAGEPVGFTATSNVQGSFTVPGLRTCETDGRHMQVQATDTAGRSRALTAYMRPQNLVSMEIGESRILSAADLGDCMQLPQGQDFVLTAFDPRLEAVEGMTDLLRFRTWTAGTNEPVVLEKPDNNFSIMADRQHTLAADGHHPHPGTKEHTTSFTGTAELFDPKYATGQVGDTLRFVNWNVVFGHATCDTPKDQLPAAALRHAEIAVVGPDNMLVIVVDLSREDAHTFLSDEGRAWLQEAADIAEPLLIPTMKELYGESFKPLPGANGRYIMMIRKNASVGSASDGGTGSSAAWCSLASEVTTATMGAGGVQNTGTAMGLVQIIVHEYAHNASWMIHGGRSHDGVLDEAWATLSEGVAFRIATDQSMNAVFTGPARGTNRAPNTQAGTHFFHGRIPQYNPSFIDAGYTAGATILMYARELFGDAPIGEGPNLYQAFWQGNMPGNMTQATPRAVYAYLAQMVGLTADELIEQAMLMSATHSLIDPDVAEAAGLPVLRTWHLPNARDMVKNNKYYNQNNGLSRTTNERMTIAAARGNYAAAYLLGDAQEPGISLSFEHRNPQHGIIRLTRLR